MARQDRDGRPYQGGSQPVQELPPEMPSSGWTVGQVIVVAIGVLVVLAAILWILVPFAG